MNIKELNEQLKKAEQEQQHDKVLELLNQINEIIKESLAKEISVNERKALEKGSKINQIKMVETKLKMNPSKNEELHLRGNLIKLLKNYMSCASSMEKNSVKLKIQREKELHRNVCKEIRTNKNDKNIKISEKLGLKIQEIGDTISLFLSKHDVINKAKKILTSTAFGGACAIGMQAIITLLLGGTVGLPTIIGSLPVVAYIGISSVVRNILEKTDYQKFAFKNSDKYKEMIKNIPVEFKEEYEEIRKLLAEKEQSKDKITINKQLIELYEKIKNTTKVEELYEVFKIEKHNLLLENKKMYEDQLDKYLKDEINLSKREYQTLMKDKLKNDISIFESENAIKEATKKTGKRFGIDTATLLAARAIASFIIPGYQITSVSDLLVPFAYIVVNNLSGFINYKGKIKSTKYDNKKIEINDKEKLAEIIQKNKLTRAMA